jgi:hypothetical protein
VAVAVVTIRVVQHSVDEIIDMIAVRNRFMATVRPMTVAGAGAGMRRVDTSVRVGGADFKAVFVVMIHSAIDGMWMMEVSVVQVIDVTVVLDRSMAAVTVVLMFVIGMAMAWVHRCPLCVFLC